MKKLFFIWLFTSSIKIKRKWIQTTKIKNIESFSILVHVYQNTFKILMDTTSRTKHANIWDSISMVILVLGKPTVKWRAKLEL